MDYSRYRSPVPKGLEISQVDRRFNVRNTMDKADNVHIEQFTQSRVSLLRPRQDLFSLRQVGPFVRSLTHPALLFIARRQTADDRPSTSPQLVPFSTAHLFRCSNRDVAMRATAGHSRTRTSDLSHGNCAGM
jgi:hypothetical protein